MMSTTFVDQYTNQPARPPGHPHPNPSGGLPGEEGADPSSIAAIVCSVLDSEVAHYAQACPNLVRIEWMPQGLHNDPPALQKSLQTQIDLLENDPRVNTIVLVYGLCSRGTEGLVTRRCTLVLPRAHDCITLLLGSAERYAKYVSDNPGTYWYSPGWNRHHTPPGPKRYQEQRQKYLEQFGEENADFLMESEQAWFQTYHSATYVHLTVGATGEDLAFTRGCADWLGWQYDQQAGDPALLRDLLSGPWDDQRFLVLAPGQTATMTADERIVEAVPATRDSKHEEVTGMDTDEHR
ncbi:MAG: DUF1638 domain-containing protein [Phycisphaeraceae bacterium]